MLIQSITAFASISNLSNTDITQTNKHTQTKKDTQIYVLYVALERKQSVNICIYKDQETCGAHRTGERRKHKKKQKKK